MRIAGVWRSVGKISLHIAWAGVAAIWVFSGLNYWRAHRYATESYADAVREAARAGRCSACGVMHRPLDGSCPQGWDAVAGIFQRHGEKWDACVAESKGASSHGAVDFILPGESVTFFVGVP